MSNGRNLKFEICHLIFNISLCLVTLALPLSRFGQSLWRDEATSVWFARLPPSTLLGGLCDPHPAGYYLFLKGWLAGGESEFWLRLPSLLAAVLAVALTYRVGREAAGRRCAWLAALLLAVHPLQIWYAGEARMYALAQALGVLAVWLGLRLLRSMRGAGKSLPTQSRRSPAGKGSTPALLASNTFERAGVEALAGKNPPKASTPALLGAGYGLAALLAVGIDYMALLPIGLLQWQWLARGRPSPRSWLGFHAAILLLAGLVWLNAGQIEGLRRSHPAVLVAIQANRLGLDLAPAATAWLLQIGMIVLALAGSGLGWLWSHGSGHRTDRRLLGLLVVVGWVGLIGLAALPRAFTVKRQLVVWLPYLALMMGYTLARLPRPSGEAVAGVGLLVTLLALPGHQREPWRAVVARLGETDGDRSAVVWVDELAAPIFDYYVRRSGSPAGQVQWTPLLGRQLPQLPALTPEPGDTLWIVAAESIYRRIVSLLPADFYGEYQLLEERHEVGIGLYHYRRRISPAPDQPELPAPDQVDRWGLLLPSPLDVCRAESSGW